MARDISNSVIVITGASSGIGRASALEFASRGATLVLAARRQGPLSDLVQECKIRGGDALAVPTDVTDKQAVQTLAQRAIEAFGHIDVWVNNAAVSMFGRIEHANLPARSQLHREGCQGDDTGVSRPSGGQGDRRDGRVSPS